MKVGIITFEQYHMRKDIGSSYIRVHQLLTYWTEAEVYKFGGQYDVVIYQKAYWIDHAKSYKGIKILDICDPDFLHWGFKFREMVDLCDGVTTSTVALAKYVKKLCPEKDVWCIPDRINIKETNLKKNHAGQGDTKKVAWFGYSENFPILSSSVTALVQLKIEELIVIANKSLPFELPAGLRGKIRLSNLPWTRETVDQDLLKADVVINPRLNYGRWKYKSNNKTITAWNLGLPVAHNKDELEKLMTEGQRIVEADKRKREVLLDYDIRKSVNEYKELINLLKAYKEVL